MYIYLEKIVTMCWDRDVEILGWIRLGWKATLKDVLKAKPDKFLHDNLFSSTVLTEILSTSKMWATTKWLDMAWRSMERFMPRIFVAWAHLKCGNSRTERNEGHDRGEPKVEVSLGHIRCQDHREEMDPCCCRVMSEKPESTTREIFTTIGKRNC